MPYVVVTLGEIPDTLLTIFTELTDPPETPLPPCQNPAPPPQPPDLPT